MKITKGRTALISVSNKTSLASFSKFLLSKNVNILSTGGTYASLRKEIPNNLGIKEVSSITNFPEMLGGRVKTLHPHIHGGILAKRDDQVHMKELAENKISPIDIVVVNLYAFQESVRNNESEDNVIENIDIGGHTLIRAAAKNYKDVLIVTCPTDYELVMANWSLFSGENEKDQLAGELERDLRDKRGIERLKFQKMLATKAWDHVVQYDMAISEYFSNTHSDGNSDLLYRRYEKVVPLKYGLNPQQTNAGLYKNTLWKSWLYQHARCHIWLESCERVISNSWLSGSCVL